MNMSPPAYQLVSVWALVLLCYLSGAALPAALAVARKLVQPAVRVHLPSWTYKWSLGWTLLGSCIAAVSAGFWIGTGSSEPLLANLLDAGASLFSSGFVFAWQL